MPMYAFFVVDWYKYMPYFFKRLKTVIWNKILILAKKTGRLSTPFIFFVYILLHFRMAWYNIFATTVALLNLKQAFRHPCKSPAGIFQPGFWSSLYVCYNTRVTAPIPVRKGGILCGFTNNCVSCCCRGRCCLSPHLQMARQLTAVGN